MRLPEERPLPNGRQMVDSIIATTQPPATRRSPALVAAAAAVVGAVVGGSLVVAVMPQDRHVGPGATATATPSLVPSVAPATTGTPAVSGDPAPLPLGQTARLGTFDVTPTEFSQHGDEFSYRLKVCVQRIPQLPGTEDGKVRLGLESWTARTTGWRTVVSDSVQVGPTTFPSDTRVGAGQCGDGLVVARVRDTNSRVVQLDYENSVGERAAWRVG